MHSIRLGGPELPAQDEDRHGLSLLEFLRQVLQLQPEVGPIPDLSIDQAKFDRARSRKSVEAETVARARLVKIADSTSEHAHEADQAE